MTAPRKISLKSSQFRKEREHGWKRLEALIAKIERMGVKSLTDEEIIDLPVQYRAALSSLSVAREISLDQSVISYLESLCARAYYLVYGTRTSMSKRIAGFFLRDWPQAVAKLGRETLASTLCFIAAALTAYFLVVSNTDWFYSFMSDGMAQGRTPAASTEYLRSTLYDDGDTDGLSAFAAYLMSHNSAVSLLAFSLGFALCVPTALLIAYNGLTIGAFVGLFASRGLGVEVMGWLFIHGTTELFAIILAGAAGFHIGLAVAYPGERTRLDAAVDAGRVAATVMGGVIVMLVIAGLLEGFGRQMVNVTWLRYTIGSFMLMGWLFYFYIYGRQQIEAEEL